MKMYKFLFITFCLLFVCSSVLFSSQFNESAQSNGRISFTDVSQKAGIEMITGTWSFQWGEMNDDGWEDIYVNNHQYSDFYSDIQTQGSYLGQAEGQNFLYRNTGERSFEEIGEEAGLDFPRARGRGGSWL
jgi:hypothetical protein